jgi:hypothetical protein
MEYKITYVQDPGHGWAVVPWSLIDALCIANKISSYSYQDFGYAYLEEDCDLPLFIRAMEDRGDTVTLIEHRTERTKIRNLQSYTYEE